MVQMIDLSNEKEKGGSADSSAAIDKGVAGFKAKRKKNKEGREKALLSDLEEFRGSDSGSAGAGSTKLMG